MATLTYLANAIFYIAIGSAVLLALKRMFEPDEMEHIPKDDGNRPGIDHKWPYGEESIRPASKLHRRINLAILCILVALIVGAVWWGMRM